jgi:hypothetical protein
LLLKFLTLWVHQSSYSPHYFILTIVDSQLWL